MNMILDSIRAATPVLLCFIAIVLALYIVNKLFSRQKATITGIVKFRHLVIFLVVFAGSIGIILTLPVQDSTRNHLMTVLGLIVSAAITLSSTTFVGNAMAGFLIKIIRNVKLGDFVEIDGNFGRISEQGFFHTEIQTPESNLTTLPNLHLIKNPVTVIRGTGTVVSATVSLGYDVSHSTIEKVLNQAAKDAGLQDPFVQILELGDFSVKYRCAGLLDDVRHYISKQTLLRASMLDLLHKNKIEIVSPNFMNQRILPEPKKFIPADDGSKNSVYVAQGPDEGTVFGKAAKAGALETFRERVKTEAQKLEKLSKELANLADESLRKDMENKVDRQKAYLAFMEERLVALEESIIEEDS